MKKESKTEKEKDFEALKQLHFLRKGIEQAKKKKGKKQ